VQYWTTTATPTTITTTTTPPPAGGAGCFATNHKDIGTLYLLFSFTMLMVGGVLALLIRAELFQPGLQVVNPELFNQLTTMHGLIMVFGAIMPASWASRTG
jgi:heme/copper-type cytochrome/quinol oxidase subunit 1